MFSRRCFFPVCVCDTRCGGNRKGIKKNMQNKPTRFRTIEYIGMNMHLIWFFFCFFHQSSLAQRKYHHENTQPSYGGTILLHAIRDTRNLYQNRNLWQSNSFRVSLQIYEMHAQKSFHILRSVFHFRFRFFFFFHSTLGFLRFHFFSILEYFFFALFPLRFNSNGFWCACSFNKKCFVSVFVCGMCLRTKIFTGIYVYPSNGISRQWKITRINKRHKQPK